jgi:hypothetical protein
MTETQEANIFFSSERRARFYGPLQSAIPACSLELIAIYYHESWLEFKTAGHSL